MFAHLAALADDNPNLTLHRAYRRLCLELRAGDLVRYLRIEPPGLTVDDVPPEGGTDIVLSASPEAWEEQQSDAPSPGYQALSTMRRCGHLNVHGDILSFNQNLLLLEMLFTPPSRRRSAPRSPIGAPYIEPISGQYLNLDFEGQPHRIYFEQAGSGIPLLCLHTAGADGRQ